MKVIRGLYQSDNKVDLAIVIYHKVLSANENEL
jgi:hypothetical protein